MAAARCSSKIAWLKENPEAYEVVREWIQTKGRRDLSELEHLLKSEHGFPFGSRMHAYDPNFATFIRQVCDEECFVAPSAEERKAPEPRPEREREAPTDERFIRTSDEIDAIRRHRKLVVTCAQNNTEVDHDFMDALEEYCRARDAKLIVIPIRYKNPTSRRDPQDETDKGYWWHPRLRRYMLENRIELENLQVLKVAPQATSPNPLNGMGTVTKGDSAVVGHPQLVVETVATPHHVLAKRMYTTGAVTVENYSDVPLGLRATFHHTIGATVVEQRPGRHPHMRELVWSRSNRCFHDLNLRCGPFGVTDAPPILALITGDEHVRVNDPRVRWATYDAPDSIVNVLRPPLIVRHDVLDFESESYHDRGKRLTKAMKAKTGRDDLQAELEEAARFIDATTPDWARNVIVASNHHHMLTRWLEGSEENVQPKNLRLWLWLRLQMLDGAREEDGIIKFPDPFAMYLAGHSLVDVECLGPNDSLQVAGIELSMHGHLGPNGARGSIKNISKVGTRSVIGHVHSPGIWQGAHAVGTSSRLRLTYNDGPSSWFQTHCVIHANGKRQLIHILDGEWR